MRKVQDDVNAKMFYALKVSEASKVPFLFISVPGVGKSTTVEMFARHRGYELVILRGNSSSAEEIMGYDVVDAANPASKSTKHLRPAWYEKVMQNHADGKKTLLFLDEITTASEWVQSALLHLIFERKVGMEAIPENTLIVSAGNYSQSLGNNFGLIPPLMNRFCIFNIVPSVKDLDIFLNKYDGAMIGKIKDKTEQIDKKLHDLDNMEIEISPTDMPVIGEYFYSGVKEQTKVLMTTGNKVVDLAVSDMQSLYQDVNNDALLKGFVTFRTLNYLVETTLAAYRLFGKEGVTCPAYKLIVQGLCGIGLSRDSSKNVVVTDVANDYFNQIKMVVEEVEKLKSSSAPVFELFFRRAIGEVAFDNGEHWPGVKGQYSNAQLNMIINKIQELRSDPGMKGLQRPIKQEILDSLCSIIKKNSQIICDSNILKVDPKVALDPVANLEPGELSNLVVSWNYLDDLLTSLREIANAPEYGYSTSTVDSLKSTATDSFRAVRRLRAMLSLYKRNKPTEYSLIPALKLESIKDVNPSVSDRSN